MNVLFPITEASLEAIMAAATYADSEAPQGAPKSLQDLGGVIVPSMFVTLAPVIADEAEAVKAARVAALWTAKTPSEKKKFIIDNRVVSAMEYSTYAGRASERRVEVCTEFFAGSVENGACKDSASKIARAAAKSDTIHNFITQKNVTEVPGLQEALRHMKVMLRAPGSMNQLMALAGSAQDPHESVFPHHSNKCDNLRFCRSWDPGVPRRCELRPSSFGSSGFLCSGELGGNIWHTELNTYQYILLYPSCHVSSLFAWCSGLPFGARWYACTADTIPGLPADDAPKSGSSVRTGYCVLLLEQWDYRGHALCGPPLVRRRLEGL